MNYCEHHFKIMMAMEPEVCSLNNQNANLRSGSIFVSLGKTFRREGRNEK